LKAPLVSVAIATWNGERFLREQLDTIYAQTWRPLEVVVSDDASTDGTVDILERYSRSRGLRYTVNSERVGLVKNFERAIAMTSGDFIALCDQDDLWKPPKIARLVDHIGEATLIYGKVAEYIDLNGHQRFDEKSEIISHFARVHGSGHPTRYLIAENWIVSHTVMFKRELITHALPIPAHQRFHDGWLALVASKLGGVTYLDESLQIYRQHSESFTFAAPPANKAANRWFRLLSGGFKPNWRSRCISETARLQDVLGLALLDPDDRMFTADLLDYYRSGLESGHGWRSFWSGAKVSGSFVTQQGLIARWLMPLKGLIASSSG
jgi:glycosyltransferase involved in cell wall biosynthesis